MTGHTRCQPSKEGVRRICKCECGGIVRGVSEFGRLWTWCEKCTPVVTFNPDAGRSALNPEETKEN